MSEIALVVAGICLAWVGVEDYIHERFNAVIAVAGVLAVGFLNFSSLNLAGFSLIASFSGVLYLGGYIRIGDLLPLSVYGLAFSSFQSFFSLLMAVGLWLYAYPIIAEREDWVAFVPGIFLAYLIQLGFYLV